MDIQSVLAKYPPEPRHLISLLQDVQEVYNYLPVEAMEQVCQYLEASLVDAWAAATFYKSFSLTPRGEHEIKVCLGTACHLKGGARLAETLERRLGIERGQTTDDLMFTLDTVNCVGACALAPVVVVDEEYKSNASSGKMKRLINKLAGDKEKDDSDG